MTILGIPILSLLIFFPILGAIVLLFINKEKAGTIRMVTLIFCLRRIHLFAPPFL